MVRYEVFRWRRLARGGGGPHAGSRRLRLSHPMQLLAPTVVLQAALARRISAVRFAATFATSLLAAGLRTVPVAAVAGPAQDNLTPAQTAIEEPTLQTHPPSPSHESIRTASRLKSGRNLLFAPAPHRPVFRCRSISRSGRWPRRGGRRNFRHRPTCPDSRTRSGAARQDPLLPPGEGHPNAPRTRTTGSVPEPCSQDKRRETGRQRQQEPNNREGNDPAKSAANRRNPALLRSR